VVLAVAVGVAACGRLPGRTDERATETAAAGSKTPSPQATVSRAVRSVVTADGELVMALEPQPLSFASGGTVVEVLVAEGQEVGGGAALARLDPQPLELGLAEARSALANAQAGLARLAGGSEMTTARLEVERAKNNLWGVQAERDATCGKVDEDCDSPFGCVEPVACDQAQAGVQAAEQAVLIAEEGLRAAQANHEPELAAARAGVESARQSVQAAQRNWEKATLTAPVTGTVTAVHVSPGVQVGPASPVVTLMPSRPLRFVTTNLGERNVADVRAGAPATVTLTAYPDHPLAATVQRVALEGAKDQSGTVVFPVYLDVTTDGLALRAAMTGRVEIQVEGE
jgi:multidrug resistance efflux pump